MLFSLSCLSWCLSPLKHLSSNFPSFLYSLCLVFALAAVPYLVSAAEPKPRTGTWADLRVRKSCSSTFYHPPVCSLQVCFYNLHFHTLSTLMSNWSECNGHWGPHDSLTFFFCLIFILTFLISSSFSVSSIFSSSSYSLFVFFFAFFIFFFPLLLWGGTATAANPVSLPSPLQQFSALLPWLARTDLTDREPVPHVDLVRELSLMRAIGSWGYWTLSNSHFYSQALPSPLSLSSWFFVTMFCTCRRNRREDDPDRNQEQHLKVGLSEREAVVKFTGDTCFVSALRRNRHILSSPAFPLFFPHRQGNEEGTD